jgi:hypothetical protein
VVTTAGVLNYIWLALVLLAVAIGGWNDRLKDVTGSALDGAKTAVTIALGLIGIMALWLGLMRLAERAGLVQRIAYGLRPLMQRLFPEVPPDHRAMGSMLMNMAANMLGLGNAATPLGLRAMRDLKSLNPQPGVFERDVHFSGDQHQFGATHSGNSDSDSGRSRVGATNGDRRHGIFRDTLRGDCGSAFGEILRAIVVLPPSDQRRIEEEKRTRAATGVFEIAVGR